MKIAILASGGGTTAEAFIRAGATGKIRTQAGLIICNNPKAGVFERIKSLNNELGLDIRTRLINHEDGVKKVQKARKGEQTEAEEQAILDILKTGNFDLVVSMGYMKKIGPKLVYEFGWRKGYTDPGQAMMVNTHPGLLPETQGYFGIHVQEYVLENQLPYSGQTLHIVAKNYDDGPTIAEHKVKVLPADSPETLFERVREAEKKYLPRDIEAFILTRQEYLKTEARHG